MFAKRVSISCPSGSIHYLHNCSVCYTRCLTPQSSTPTMCRRQNAGNNHVNGSLKNSDVTDTESLATYQIPDLTPRMVYTRIPDENWSPATYDCRKRIGDLVDDVWILSLFTMSITWLSGPLSPFFNSIAEAYFFFDFRGQLFFFAIKYRSVCTRLWANRLRVAEYYTIDLYLRQGDTESFT